MRFYSNLLILFAIITTWSCQSVRVAYDYDRDVDFNRYQSYNYPADLDTGLSELDTKRLLRITDSIMKSRGYVQSPDPDLLLDIYSQSFEIPNRNTVGIGVGGTGRNVGGGIQVGIPISGGDLNREIVFNFVDSQRDQLVFQAISESKYRDNASPSYRWKILRETAAKVFEGYPPE